MNNFKNELDKQYLALLNDILNNGVTKTDRTGVGTKSVFGREIRHNMKEGFPLLTSKKMFTKGVIVELLWFLTGSTNIQPLVKQGVNIWNGDAYKKYMEGRGKHEPYTMEEFVEKIKTDDSFAEYHGKLGPIYGHQWVKWGYEKYWAEDTSLDAPWNRKNYMKEVVNKGINQIQQLVDDLKKNPDSRRLMVNAWNVDEIPQMTLPPCHYGFQCYTRELNENERFHNWFNKNKPNRDVVDYFETLDTEGRAKMLDESNVPKRELSLMWQQRSVDTFLGLPFNIASYAFLLEILAQQSNMISGELIGSLGDTHLYLNHLEAAEEQLKADIFELPTLQLNKATDIFSYKFEDFKIENYNSSNTIKAQLNN
jgi:thymidylate synthase